MDGNAYRHIFFLDYDPPVRPSFIVYYKERLTVNQL